MYRLIGVDSPCEPSPLKLDLLAGARYYQVDGAITIDPLLLPILNFERCEEWVDLVIGARAAYTVADGLDAFIRADFGGFGIGTSSLLAWNLITGVEMALPKCSGSSLVAGYRVLDIDESQTDVGRAFAFDVRMQGPFVALAFRF